MITTIGIFGFLNKNLLSCPYFQIQAVFSILNIFLYLALFILIEIHTQKSKKNGLNPDNNLENNLIENEQYSIARSPESIQEDETIRHSNPSDFSLMIRSLYKTFISPTNKQNCIVNNVSFGIKKGEFFGVVGPNGAGKTTLLKMIMGIIPSDYGQVFVNNNEVTNEKFCSDLFFCDESNDLLEPGLTINDNLIFISLLFNTQKTDFDNIFENILPILGLDQYLNTYICDLPKEISMLVSIAVSLISPSDIIIFDEPTSSLDEISRIKVHKALSQFRGKKTIILCTHLLYEVELLCDRIAMMVKGSIYTIGSPQYLSSKYAKEWNLSISIDHIDESTNAQIEEFMLQSIPSSSIVSRIFNNIVFAIPSDSIQLSNVFRIAQQAKDQDMGIKSFSCASSNLEKVFLELIRMYKQPSE